MAKNNTMTQKSYHLRNNDLLHVVDSLLANHNDDELLSQFHQAATWSTLKTNHSWLRIPSHGFAYVTRESLIHQCYYAINAFVYNLRPSLPLLV